VNLPGMAKAQEGITDLPVMEETELGVLSVAKAAQRLGVSRNTLYEAIRSRRLVAYRAPGLGNTQDETVIKLADLETFRVTMRPNKRRPSPAAPTETEQATT